MPSRQSPVLFIALAVSALPTVGCGSATPPPAAAERATVVHGVHAQQADVFAWVYGQGTATAVRRKALYFQLEGKVSYVARGPDGGELRLGDAIEGPRDEDLLGQLIAKVDDRDALANIEATKAELSRSRKALVSTEAQLKSTQAELDAARRELKRVQTLQASGTVGQAEVDNAQTRVETATAGVESARSQLDSSRSGTKAQAAQVKRSEIAHERAAIFAPFDGIIAALNVREGDYVLGTRPSADPGEQLRTAPVVVIDPSAFEVDVELPEFEASKVKVGQPAFVLTGEDLARISFGGADPAARPELLATQGEVFAVSPSIDPTARSVQVTVRVTEKTERMRDGEFVSAFIMIDKAEQAVSVPYEGFIREDEHVFAFVVPEGGSKAVRRDLELGLNGVEHVQIKSGIEAGELVVTRGRRSLGDGSLVDVARVEGEGAQ